MLHSFHEHARKDQQANMNEEAFKNTKPTSETKSKP